MSYENNMDKFFDWLAKPMKDEDVIAWYLANNITIELTNLFRDFIISFLDLLKDTYLGDDTNTDSNLTKVGMTVEQKKDHFNWCWEKIVENFKKENINFKFEKVDYEIIGGMVFMNLSLNHIRENPEKYIKYLNPFEQAPLTLQS
jgi:hypothetical protein